MIETIIEALSYHGRLQAEVEKEKNMKEFNTPLCSFDDTGDKEELESFLYHNAIFGIDRSEQ